MVGDSPSIDPEDRKLAANITKLIQIKSANNRCPSCITIGAKVKSVAVPNAIWARMRIERIFDQRVTFALPVRSFANQPLKKITKTLVRIAVIG